MSRAAAQKMLDTICEAVKGGLEDGETRVHVTIAHEITRKARRTDEAPTVTTEFVVVEGFACASTECSQAHHVRVLAAQPMYEYPDHLAHRSKL